MTLHSQRHLFRIPRDLCYLNAAYMTPQTIAMEATGTDAVRLASTPWDVGPEQFFEPVEAVRGKAAGLFDCSGDDIAIVPATSYGIATAAANLPIAAGEAILVLEDQFPSNIYGWRRLAEETGAEIVTVGTPADQDWTSAALEMTARLGERLAIAALPNTHWSTGAHVDLVRLRPALTDAGASLVLDLTQSLGAMPFSVKQVDPDFAIASSYKWLFGPYGVGFMYVAPRHQGGRPLEENWIARKGSEDFTRLVDYQSEYQSGARRFDMGERSQFILMPLADSALSQILEWGTERIAASIDAINERIAAIFEAIGEPAIPRNLRSPHMLGIRATSRPSTDWAAHLKQHRVVVSARADYIRISPHLWVDDTDLELIENAVNN